MPMSSHAVRFNRFTCEACGADSEYYEGSPVDAACDAQDAGWVYHNGYPYCSDSCAYDNCECDDCNPPEDEECMCDDCIDARDRRSINNNPSLENEETEP